MGAEAMTDPETDGTVPDVEATRPSIERFQMDGSVGTTCPCLTCVHLMEDSSLPLHCSAFPGEVPIEIRRGDHQHRTPFEGDGGFRWAEPADPEPETDGTVPDAEAWGPSIDRFVMDGSVGKPFPCATCAHRFTDSYFPVRCAAFPGGVPRAMLFGDHQHRKPYEGDRGIQWEQRDWNIPTNRPSPSDRAPIVLRLADDSLATVTPDRTWSHADARVAESLARTPYDEPLDASDILMEYALVVARAHRAKVIDDTDEPDADSGQRIE